MTNIDIYAILASKPHNPHYLNRYWKFIQACRNNNLIVEGIKEKHHILPKAKDLFPEYKSFSSNPWNKVLLTPRQHFIAHWILWRTFKGVAMAYAFISMSGLRCGEKTSERISSKIYTKLRNECSGINHPIYGFTLEQRFGKKRADMIKAKMSGINSSAKKPESRKNNSAAKQNRAWYNDGTKEVWVDSSQVNSHLIPGRISKHSTVTQVQIDRSIKTFGFDQEEKFREILTEQAKTGKFYMSNFYQIYPKSIESRFRDPAIRFFLKKYDLVKYLKTNSVSHPINCTV